MPGRDDNARLQQTAIERTRRIAALNDLLRCQGIGGRVAITGGVMALGDGALRQILRDIAASTSFDEDNDPHGEHDFGVVHHGDAKVFWTIDYYDRLIESGSPDPADPAVTTRMLTVMLAEEW